MAFVPSCLRCLRAFASCLRAFVPSLHTTQVLINFINSPQDFTSSPVFDPVFDALFALLKSAWCHETPYSLPSNRAEVNISDSSYRIMLFPSQGVLSCEDHYREALRLRPHFVTAWENLGLVLLNTSKNV